MQTNLSMMSQSMKSASKVISKFGLNDYSHKGSSFTKQLEKVLQKVSDQNSMLNGVGSEGAKLSSQDLSNIMQSLEKLFESLPEELFTLKKGMLESIKDTALWNQFPENIKSTLQNLFNGENNITDIIQNVGDLKQPIQLFALTTWFKGADIQQENDGMNALQNNLQEWLAKMDLLAISNNQSKESVKVTTFVQHMQHSLSQEVVQSPVLTDSLNPEQFKAQLKEINNVWNQLIQEKGQTPGQLAKLEKQMLELAEKWLKLEKQVNLTEQERRGLLQQLKQQGVASKTANAFEQALANLQKRQVLSNQNQYGHNSKVTSKEFAQWIRNSIQRMDTTAGSKNDLSNKSFNYVSSLDAMPMSKQEQLVIKLNTSQSNQGMQKQLVEEFQKIMDRSRFLTNRNGTELSIKLRPGNLGDLTVRMMQQNGEMMVKIMVTSQAAKEMLEGNLQQLRHMFSPNQVVIEKQDVQVASQQNESFLKEDDSKHEEQSRDNSSNNNKVSSDEDENNEDVSFHELLMNEKV